MKHLDLFSGIGGFALAAQTVWGGAYENIGFCDNNLFCQAVLKKHWPESKIYADIKELTGDRIASDTDERRHIHGESKKQSAKGHNKTQRQFGPGVRTAGLCDIITGGFPCQPFSNAGLRKGTEDDRHLWPEMLRVIREVSPRWVVGENVRGLTNWNGGMVFEQVQVDLEAIGYEVQSFIIPAVAVDAPHRRDRVWIIAYRASDRRKRSGQTIKNEKRHEARSEQTGKLARGFERSYSTTSDTKSRGSKRGDRIREEQSGNKKKWSASWRENERRSWNRNWLDVATKLCRVDDGLPVELDEFKLTKSKHRAERLKSLGNAIVPQVAIQIFNSIKQYEKNTKENY